MKDFFSGTDGKLLNEIITTLEGNGFYAYLAGGCVRDYLLNREWQDIDVVTDAKPEDVERLFPKTLSIGKQFGIMVVVSGNSQIEVATFRADGEYVDGRHPEFIQFSEPSEDAKRRDFTVNALFYDFKTKKIIDFVEGEADLKNRLIRAVGDPRKRFQEDHLRLLRALRFAVQLDFTIDPPTWDAIKEFAPKISEVSIERIRDELRKLLSVQPERSLEWLAETGLFVVLFPDLIFCPHWTNLQMPFTEENHLKWMIPLLLISANIQKTVKITNEGDWSFSEELTEFVQKWCKNWKLSKQDEKNLKLVLCAPALAESWQKLRNGVQRDLVLSSTEKILFLTLLQLKSAISIREELKSLELGVHPEPFLNGKDLMALPASSLRSEVLREAWYLQLEGFLKNREQALNWLKKQIPSVTASTFKRIIAHLIDEALVFVFYAPVYIKGMWLYFAKQDLVIPWFIILFPIGIRILYEAVFVYFLNGLPGQLLMGLRVQDSNFDKQKIFFVQSFIRALADRMRFFISIAYYAVGFLNSSRQHLGDLLSETRVVQEDNREEPPVVRKWTAIILIAFGILYGLSGSIQLLQELHFNSYGVDFENLVVDSKR
jgi:tRNA nucleotidyltransferase (CCA-adding enzyme)